MRGYFFSSFFMSGEGEAGEDGDEPALEGALGAGLEDAGGVALDELGAFFDAELSPHAASVSAAAAAISRDLVIPVP
jgi:hypothetical protein